MAPGQKYGPLFPYESFEHLTALFSGKVGVCALACFVSVETVVWRFFLRLRRAQDVGKAGSQLYFVGDRTKEARRRMKVTCIQYTVYSILVFRFQGCSTLSCNEVKT